MKLFGPPKGMETLPRYLFKYMPQFVISSIGGIIYNTVIVLGPILLGNLIDYAGGGAGLKVLLSAIYFVGVTAFFQLARFVKRWFMRDQFNRVACDLRQTFMERMLLRSLPGLEKETVGDLMSRTVGDITLVVDTVMTTLNEGWDTWLLMISYFVALMFKDWKITLIASVMVPLTILLAQNMRHILYRYSMAARKAASASSGGLTRYLDAAAVLRLFGREASEAEGIRASFEKQTNYNIKEMLLQQALLPVYSLIAGLGIVAVIAMGGQMVVSGDWTIGSFNAYLVMFIAFSGRTRVAARVFNRWHAARAAWSRVKEKLAKTSDLPTREAAGKPDCRELRVQNLNFGFEDGSDIIHDISFTARKGQIIGITGSVGSGKTSLAHALTGLYPYKGSITLDGTEISGLPAEARSRLIAYTGHEQFLFSMSIKDNIRLSEEDESSLDLALAASALKKDIEVFDAGLDTVVGEKGMRVSGGQRQRIAMARAIHSGAPVLLLDDPFSAVDILTEAEMIERLKQDYKDRIVLLFTHRLTAFPYADNILVLKSGKIIAQGNHDSLMKEEGLYKEIYNAQVFMEGNANA
jgi:ABC-type multidrug transport system fused ATPase/permease subunit